MPKAKNTEAAVAEKITIAPLVRNRVKFTLKGDSPLIMNRMGNKVDALLKGMTDTEPTTKKKNRKPKNPEGDFLNALHVISGEPRVVKRNGKVLAIGAEYGFPAGGVKEAIMSGCMHMGRGVNQTLARSAFYVVPEDVEGNYVKVHHKEPPFMRTKYRIISDLVATTLRGIAKDRAKLEKKLRKAA